MNRTGRRIVYAILAIVVLLVIWQILAHVPVSLRDL